MVPIEALMTILVIDATNKQYMDIFDVTGAYLHRETVSMYLLASVIQLIDSISRLLARVSRL